MMSEEKNEIPLVVITYEDGFLWSIKHKKEDYKKAASVIQLSEKDINILGISSGQTINLKNKLGQLQVRVEVEKSCPKGFGLMPKSSVINQLTSYDEELPDLKSIEIIAYR